MIEKSTNPVAQPHRRTLIALASLAVADWAVKTGVTPACAGTTAAAPPDTDVSVLRYIPPEQWPSIVNGTREHDVTEALQKALQARGRIFVPAGLYVVGPLFVSSQTQIRLSPQAIIEARPGYKDGERLLNIVNASDVVIHGNGASIQMLGAEYQAGEQRHCVNINGSSNVSIHELTARSSGGDGFYVGGHRVCRNIQLINCVADGNRRQGLSITNAVGMLVSGGEYRNTAGTAPAAGIDIEANPLPDYFLQQIRIENVRTSGNAGAGILVVPNDISSDISVFVTGWTSNNDTFGFIASNSPLKKKMRGRVEVENARIINPRGPGGLIQKWNEFAPVVVLRRVEIVNPGSDIDYSNKSEMLRCGFALWITTGYPGTRWGNLELTDLRVIDNRATVRTFNPVRINAGATGVLESVQISGLVANAWTYPSSNPVLIQAGRGTRDVHVQPPTLIVQRNQPSQALTPAHLGVTVGNGPNHPQATYRLPVAASMLGSEFAVAAIAHGKVRLVASPGDRLWLTPAGEGWAGLVAQVAGASIRVKAAGEGRWDVVTAVGSWVPE